VNLLASGRRSLLGFLLIVLVVPPTCGCGGVSESSLAEASNSVGVAEEAVSSAFEVVLEAEGVGADVSGLVVELNGAVGLLVEARVLLAVGLVDEAVEAADLAVEVAWRVRNEAAGLEFTLSARRDSLFWASVLGGAVGVPVFLVSMWFVWRWFRGFYVRRVLGLKPEVPGDVEA